MGRARQVAPVSRGRRYPGSTKTAGLVKAVLVLGAISMVADVGAIISSLMQISMLKDVQAGMGLSETQGLVNDAREALFALATAGSFIVIAIVSGIWMVRANRRAQQFVSNGLSVSPGWTVGWYFIPFANLWYPLKAMKEMWLASAHGHERRWRSRSMPSILAIWWVLWVANNVLGQFLFRQNPQTVEDWIGSSKLDIGAAVLSIVLTGVFLKVVHTLEGLQNNAVSVDVAVFD